MYRIRSFVIGATAAGLLCAPAAALSNVSLWADDAVCEAYLQGLQPSLLTNKTATGAVTRAEFCAVALRTYEAATGLVIEPTDAALFTDCSDKFVNTAAQMGLVSGRGNGKFDPNATISRQELCVMLGNVLKVAKLNAPTLAGDAALEDYPDVGKVADWAYPDVTRMVDHGIMKGVAQKDAPSALSPLGKTTRQESLILASRFTTAFGDPMALRPEPEDESWTPEEVLGDTSGLDAIYALAGGKLSSTNAEKMTLVFGAGGGFYTNQAVAEGHITEIEIPVWRLKSNGEKVTGKAYLKVNEAIAPLVAQIFNEIYHGAEKFPIKSIGGYAWRDRTTSEHRYGTAIDINWNENMEATILADGTLKPTTGSYWRPGSDPYSIREGGDVYNAFAKYGFSWGGNAWRSKRDYMHFSYFGK